MKRTGIALVAIMGLSVSAAHATPVRSHMDAHSTPAHTSLKHQDSKKSDIDRQQEEYEQKYAIPQDRGTYAEPSR